MNLQDKVCLITGGTRGIGAATALEFAKRGANLALNGRYIDDEESQSVLREIEALGRKCILLAGDMSDPNAARQCVEATAQHFGKLDVLVHSAGGPVPGSFLKVSEEAWNAAFDVHVHAVFHLGRAAIPHMKAQGEGAIILIASSAAIRGVLNAAAYATVKGTLIQLTRVMARELADDNIRVNCAAPGVVRTRFQDILTPEQVKNNLDNRIPLHREGQPYDVAQVIAMLAENEFMTGETVVMDGGLTMRIA